ncbi:MAG TPA: beta-propeller fold lactonase family protein, partial [Terriglobales bacterium]|nr:beta-propeller fold lactonase family protein [Terriglobales bacterium]
MERKLCGMLVLPAAACLLLLAGCGGGGKKTLYVTGQGSSAVENFTVSGSGALTANGSTSTGANPSVVVADPQQKYAFVANVAGGVSAGAVSQYTVAGNGLLSANTSNIGISTTSSTIPPAPVGINPLAMAIDPGGKFLFVANQGSNTVSVFTIDRSNGVLAEVSGSPFATGASPSGIAASSKAVYVANTGAGTISAYTYNSSGALTAVSGSPFAAGSTPTALALANNDAYLYAADRAGNAVLG